jgi:WG containing repeat
VTKPSRLLLLVVVLMGGLSFWSCSKSSKPKKPLEGLYIIAGAGKFGFIDKSGKVVIPPQFQYAFPFSEGLAQIRSNDGTSLKVGFIDKTGKAVIPLQFSDAADFSEDFALVRTQDGTTAFIDRTGKLSISAPPEVDIEGGFSEGLVVVKLKQKDPLEQSKYGYMDKTGKLVITPQFEIAFNFSEGLALVKTDADKPFQYIDTAGKPVIKVDFDPASPTSGFHTAYSFSEGLAAITICDSGCKFRFIDKTGKIVGDKYDYAGFFREGVAVVGIGTEAKYSPEWMRNKPEYYRPKYSGGKYGYIDNTGKPIFKTEFDEAYAFNDGMALVRIGNKYGYIDKSGKTVINPQFDYAESFQEGLAHVAVGNKRGYINTSGQFVWSNGN